MFLVIYCRSGSPGYCSLTVPICLPYYFISYNWVMRERFILAEQDVPGITNCPSRRRTTIFDLFLILLESYIGCYFSIISNIGSVESVVSVGIGLPLIMCICLSIQNFRFSDNSRACSWAAWYGLLDASWIYERKLKSPMFVIEWCWRWSVKVVFIWLYKIPIGKRTDFARALLLIENTYKRNH